MGDEEEVLKLKRGREEEETDPDTAEPPSKASKNKNPGAEEETLEDEEETPVDDETPVDEETPEDQEQPGKVSKRNNPGDEEESPEDEEESPVDEEETPLDEEETPEDEEETPEDEQPGNPGPPQAKDDDDDDPKPDVTTEVNTNPGGGSLSTNPSTSKESDSPANDSNNPSDPLANGQKADNDPQEDYSAQDANPQEQGMDGLPPGVPSGLPNNPVDPTQAATVTNPDSMVEERAELASEFVGRVIGKGGEMIRDLQARSGCRVDVDQNVPAGSPRIITYRGTRKAVDFAKDLVEKLCSDEGKEAELPLGMAAREQLIVPTSSIGKIIGRGGEMIRDMQNRSKAKIQVDHSGAGVSDPTAQRQIVITGTEEAVTKAEEMILFLVANPAMDALEALNMLVDDKIRGGSAWGSGPPYPNLPNQGQGMQVGSGYQGLQGGPPSPGGGDGYYGYQQPPAAYGGGYGGGPPAGAGGVEMEVIHAGKMCMGRIIGQRGVTINDLQKRSGCDIQINQDVPPGYEPEISIRGNRQGIEMAKKMVRDIIEMGPNHPYAGGTQQQGGGYYAGAEYQQGGAEYQQGGAEYQLGGTEYQLGGYGQGYPAYQYQQPMPQAPAPQYGYPAYGAAPYQAPMYGQPELPSYQAAPSQQYGMPPQYGVYGQQQPRPMPQGPAPSAWRAATTNDGQTYYYNEASGETQWEKPPGM